MNTHRIVSPQEWIEARKAHLAQEKEFTRLRDELSRARRELPWVKVDQRYELEGPEGKVSLADLFGTRRQLVVYHFMFGPDWAEGCPSCSFWADNFDGIVVHLNHRDISFAAISRAPLDRLAAYKRRLGWHFPWYSSLGSDFNRDFHVSFSQEEVESGSLEYNYEKRSFPSTEAPGISVFFKSDDDEVYHTYSCYARGLDMLNGAYHFMDLTPKGRDEDDMPRPMAWLRRHDRYED